MQKFMVKASHVAAKYDALGRAGIVFEVHADSDRGFYVEAENLGCSKTYKTAEIAIACMLNDWAFSLISKSEIVETPKYEVSTVDICAEGNERLRSYSEFILVAHVGARQSVKGIKEQWRDDIQACMRPDGFDFDAARKCVDDAKLSPRDLHGANGCTAYLYIRVEGAHFPVF